MGFGTSSGPRWGALPEVVIACLILVACICVASCLSGCGASALRTHAQAATVAAVATQGAARMVEQAAVAECPDTANDDADRACVNAALMRWAPADAAVTSTRAALLAWVEALDVARLAGDGADLWAPLAVAAARMLQEYERLRVVLGGLDVDLPALPPMVLSLASGLGGAQ